MKSIRRHILTLICLIVLMSALVISASAEKSIVRSGNLNNAVSYVLYDDGQLVISGSGATSFTSYSSPFRYKSDIQTVVVEEGITTIHEELFESCKSLTSITLPSSVRTIEASAFEDCAMLTTVTFSKGLTTIEGGAFESCTALTSIVFPEGLTTIGSGIFEECTSLKSVVMPNSVTTMGTRVFKECSALESVTLSNKLTTIPERTFYQCSALKEISLHKGITSVGEYAFYKCEALSSITLPSTVTTISDYAFSRDAVYDLFVLPKSLTTLTGGDYTRHIPAAKTLVILNKNLKISTYQVSFSDTTVIGYPGSSAETIAKDSSSATFLSIYCEAPELDSVANTTSGVMLKWKKNPNATSYTILRKAAGKDKWTTVETVDNKTLKFEDTTAKAGTKYTYTVRADNKWEKGKYNSDGLAITRLTKPSIKSANSSEEGIKLSWDKVEGAKTYMVYRNKKLVAEVTARSYTDISVQNGKSYTYYIVAKSAIESTSAKSSSSKVSVKHVSPTDVTLSVPKTSQIKVSWKKISGADKYVVYRSTNATKGFKKITTTKSTSYTDKSVKFGTKYYYKVQVVDGKKSSNSDVVSIKATIPAASFNTSVNVTAKSVTLAWKKVSAADGYYLYIKSGDNWKKIATIKGNSTTSYKYSTKSGKTFKAVAYVKKDGKTYCSADSIAYFTPLGKASSLEVSRYNDEFANKVTWKAVKNATGYQLYRKFTSSGDWKKVKTLTTRQYTSDVQHGEFCYWKVKAIYEKDGYTSVGPYSDSDGLIIYNTPNFSGFVSSKTSTSKWAIVIITNNGKYNMRVKSSGARIWNGSNYPHLNGSISLVNSDTNKYTKSVLIKAGESESVFFYIDGPSSAYYDENTRITFNFEYDGVRYEATTNPKRYGLNKVTYTKTGFVDD